MLEVQRIVDDTQIPTNSQLHNWSKTAITLVTKRSPLELVIRIVDKAESANLNMAYRRKSGPTNILSFPFKANLPIPSNLLGDLVICLPLVAEEACVQSKDLFAHWAHLIVHGILHLLDYDHDTPANALIMENLERTILYKLNYPDPYAEAEPPSSKFTTNDT
ncbi:hypothetical protein TI04_08355 [Achromatium sp. WMS2]|nr:hypothetical protein TI04_08355 [Achromatium sp. WMS2]